MKIAFDLVSKWFVRAAWAPVAVVLVQQLFSRSNETDLLMHFFGGAAMAFFFYQGTLVFDSLLGRPLPILRHLLVLGLICGVVIAWELLELTSDRLFDSRFQASISETMGDQFCGVLGSTVILGGIAVIERWGRTTASHSERH